MAAIPAPPFRGFELGPLEVRVYGLLYVVAIAAAMWIAARRWQRRGGSTELVWEVALWGVPAGIVGARLYHVVTSWDQVPATWWGPFAVWEGGLGIWGGIALGALAGIWVVRRRGAHVASFMDAAAPGLLVAQAIGRLGNYFNQELFGIPTQLPWALEVDPIYRPEAYAEFATFHPVFLYEALANLALAAALVWIGAHRVIRPPGLFALYVAGYSFIRIFEELVRTDPAQQLLGLRLNFYVAAALFATGLAWFAWTQRRSTRSAAPPEQGAAKRLSRAGRRSRSPTA
jgi:prolipoprotein diacylglyceryl transferase